MKEKEQTFFSKLFTKIKWAMYDLSVKLFGNKKTKIELDANKSRRFKKNLFLFLFLLFPIVQFIIFYIGVNINSILLAFKSFEGGKWVFCGFDNFKEVWDDLFVNGRLNVAVKNSTIQFALSFLVGIPLHVIVAFVMFRGVPGSKFLRFVLFMPNMISSLVFVICFRYLASDALPLITGIENLNILKSSQPSSFYTVLLFGFWLGFAGGLIIYLGAMSSISTDVLEYCELENMSSLRLLWSIIVPLIFPTIITYIVVGMAGFFTSYGQFHSFFGAAGKNSAPPYETLGYVFFVTIARDSATVADYPYAAAGGLMFTMVIAPLTVGIKSLLEKYGPGVD
ncbi:MAG: sugar ABC transporter permease [Clostridia bacterium]|nr:sugar ABC transporter permease [Clostridia bacterium]